MTERGQRLTKDVYEDPEIVSGYIEANSKNPTLAKTVESFAKTLSGNKVIDVGCGPGHDAYTFAELGFNVVGVDYSSEMVKAARGLKSVNNQPEFKEGDMRRLGEMFNKDSFDGAWVSASLLHIPQEEASSVLKGIHKIVKDGGKVYVGLKGGEQGEQIVSDAKYGKPMEREFTFWEKNNFQELAKSQGFTIDNEQTQAKSSDTWLNFFLGVKK